MKQLCAAALSLFCIPLFSGMMASASDAKTPDARADMRLDRKISITVAYDSLDELCARLQKMSGVAITVDPAIRDQKVVVRVREQPLRDVMRQIALLFDFDWTQQGTDNPTYLLTQSQTRAALGPSLRERYLKEANARELQLFKNALRAAVATPEERRELAKTDADAVTLAATYPLAYRVLATLDAPTLDSLLAGREVRIPIKSLPKETSEALAQSILEDYKERGQPQRREDWLWDDATIIYNLTKYERPWSSREWIEIRPAKPKGAEPESVNADALGVRLSVLWANLAWGLASEPARTVDAQRLSSLKDNGIDVMTKGRSAAIDALPEWARPKPGPEPAASGQTVTFQLDREAYADRTAILAEVADKLGFDLMADCYWTNGGAHSQTRHAWPRYPDFDPKTSIYSVDANPEYTLDRLCRQWAYAWAKDGDFFRMRDLWWFVDDAEEAPASVLNEWMRRTDSEKHISADDYVWLASSLTEEQAGNLGGTAYRGRYYYPSTGQERDYEELRVLQFAWRVGGYGWHTLIGLYGRLSSDLRAKAETRGVLVSSELPQDLRPLVRHFTEVQRAVGNSPFRNQSDEEITAILDKTRLWAGYRVSFGDGPEGDVTFTPSPTLCIELRTGGDPNWSGRSEEEGLLNSCWLPLRLGNEPQKGQGGKQSGTWRRDSLSTQFAAGPTPSGLTQSAGGLWAVPRAVWATASSPQNDDPSTATAATEAPAYIRIRVSPAATLYVQFRETELRVASTAAGLATAQPIAASNVTSRFVTFPIVSLPATSNSGPVGSATLKAAFLLLHAGASGGAARVGAGFNLSRRDKHGAVWTYASTVQSPSGPAPESAPLIQAADPGKLTLTVVTTASLGAIGAGLRITAGAPGQFAILKDGKDADAEVRVLDSKGKVIRSHRGPLAEFGFT